jgi:dTMP kinase
LNGRFITLEGGEGVGKSTQLPRLADALRQRGHSVIVTREPGGTPGAEAVRALLLSGAEDRWSVRAEALLFAAARADHVDRIIRPALIRGDWVICDRFIDSTRAYQGGPDGIDDDDIMALHRIGSGGLLPDRTMLLALDRAQGAQRSAARDGDAPDRMGARGAAYYEAVDRAFTAMAADDPDRFRVIDAHGPVGTVTARMLAALDDII